MSNKIIQVTSVLKIAEDFNAPPAKVIDACYSKDVPIYLESKEPVYSMNRHPQFALDDLGIPTIDETEEKKVRYLRIPQNVFSNFKQELEAVVTNCDEALSLVNRTMGSNNSCYKIVHAPSGRCFGYYLKLTTKEVQKLSWNGPGVPTNINLKNFANELAISNQDLEIIKPLIHVSSKDLLRNRITKLTEILDAGCRQFSQTHQSFNRTAAEDHLKSNGLSPSSAKLMAHIFNKKHKFKNKSKNMDNNDTYQAANGGDEVLIAYPHLTIAVANIFAFCNLLSSNGISLSNSSASNKLAEAGFSEHIVDAIISWLNK